MTAKREPKVTKTKKLPKVKSWSELWALCVGTPNTPPDTRWQKVVIGALENLGNPTLRYNPSKGDVLWRCAYYGLQAYIDAMVGEYGETEDKAERQVLDEVNFVRDICDDVKLV